MTENANDNAETNDNTKTLEEEMKELFHLAAAAINDFYTHAINEVNGVEIGDVNYGKRAIAAVLAIKEAGSSEVRRNLLLSINNHHGTDIDTHVEIWKDRFSKAQVEMSQQDPARILSHMPWGPVSQPYRDQLRSLLNELEQTFKQWENTRQ